MNEMLKKSYFVIDQEHLNVEPKNDNIPVKISAKHYAFSIWLFAVNKDRGLAWLDGIYRDGLINLLIHLGYFKRYRPDNSFQYIHEEDNIIKAVEIAQIRDAVNDIVQNSDPIKFDYGGLTFEATAELQKETLLRSSPSLFNDSVLGHLPNHEKPVLHDTRNIMYFPFLNCVAKVTKEGVVCLDFKELDEYCIWQDHLIKRLFNYTHLYEDAQYAQFIKNVAPGDDRFAAFISAIGYLIHNNSSPNTARAVIAYDEQIAGKHEPAGGTGKGIFGQAIGQLRNTAVIDGKKIREDNQFSYQMVTERTQVISFDDVKHDFNFLMLNSNLTAGWQIEQKNKSPFRFPETENPKTYITSNTILKAEGTTATRRQFVLEFSAFYSRLAQRNLEPIITIHGGMFFTDWNQDEWNRFFSFMLNCGKIYLRKGLQFYKLRAVSENRLLQNTSDDFMEWVKVQPFTVEKEFSVSELYSAFKEQYYGGDSDFKQRSFTNWLKILASTRDWELITRRSDGKTIGKFKAKQYTSTQDSIIEGNPMS